MLTEGVEGWLIEHWFQVTQTKIDEHGRFVFVYLRPIVYFRPGMANSVDHDSFHSPKPDP